MQHLELTDILDPYLFDNHRDIINALFVVYHDLSDSYLEEFYDKPKLLALSNNELNSVYIDFNE